MNHSERYSFLENMMVLRQCEIFETLTPTELRRIADVVTEVTLQNGEVVVGFDDVHAHFYVVKSGQLVLRSYERDGTASKEIERKRKYDHIGGATIFVDYFRYPYEVVATQKTTLLSLKREDIYHILRNNPSSALRILEFFAKQLVKINKG